MQPYQRNEHLDNFNRMNQLCKVCGEPAAGFHFGAFTCEGCKSFFGRTYNNLSQIHECKNGGSCVINKQNRTSCKACRLRKCLMVGMSKSGSRYGRRSNWFKIHCLLQEQASYNSQPQNFRTPVTPTLQDGSLPFVASHLRDPITGLETDISGSSGTSIPISSHSPNSGIGVSCSIADIPRMTSSFSSTFSHNSYIPGDRRLHDGLVSGAPRSVHLSSPIDCTYREHLLNLIQRTHGLDPILNSPDSDTYDETRRQNHDFENSLGPLAFLEWKKRLREAAKRNSVDVLLERKTSSCSPVKDNGDTIDDRKDEEQRFNNEAAVAKLRNSQSLENISAKRDTKLLLKTVGDEHEVLTRDSKEIALQNIAEKGIRLENKEETLMNDADRFSFLKSPSNHPSNLRCGRFESTFRFPGRDAFPYNPVNNNILSFPPYPHLWPSMIQFPPFSKLYPPFCPPRIQNPVSLDPIKPPHIFSLLDPPSPRINLSEPSSKEDPITKKRNLDAILQFQREASSPCRSSSSESASSSVAPSVRSLVSLPLGISIHPTTSCSNSVASASDQPIDLTVRRKRKMDKSEIVYKPGDDLEEMESDSDKETKEHKPVATERMEIKVSEIETSPIMKQKFEVPLKVIKLETNNETLTV